MAQQTLDFVIAQQVTGQADVARLIKSVGALDAEMQKLRSATQGMGAGFNQAAGAIRGNTNVLDAQSKALRNQRQGMQQVGMQINDFATSVSTGASVTQAFNQQIGQVGYAMSMMGGTAGRVGTFLAGPWGAAVTVAVMVLGQLADAFFDSGEEADNAKQKTEEYTQVSYAQKMASESLIGVTDELNRLSGRYTLTVQEQAAAIITVAKAKIQETEKTLNLAIAQAALNEERLKGFKLTQQIQGFAGGDGGRAAAAATGFLAGRTEMSLEESKKRIEGIRSQLKAAQGALNFLETNGVKAETTTARAARGAREVVSPMQRFLDSLKKGDDRVALARQAYEDGTISLSQYRQEFEKADKAQRDFSKTAESQIKVLKDGGQDFQLPDMVKEIQTPPALQEILDKNKQIEASFQSIGNSVASAFQGMITGAQSFGDAMKGIINAVIEELFRLFVVQQIVGFVSATLGGVTGVPTTGLPARALGGSVGQNKPYLVGERGPELFVPGKSGTIIPTQNTPNAQQSGGVTINVDARGSTDPEAVRRQVQQGILEAAPSIVAAAEQRTISTLRRPRLAGVM